MTPSALVTEMMINTGTIRQQLITPNIRCQMALPPTPFKMRDVRDVSRDLRGKQTCSWPFRVAAVKSEAVAEGEDADGRRLDCDREKLSPRLLPHLRSDGRTWCEVGVTVQLVRCF